MKYAKLKPANRDLETSLNPNIEGFLVVVHFDYII